MNGFYCVIEGIDGAGKTTVTAEVAARLGRLLPGRQVLVTRHPGATALGRHLRQLLKYPETIDPEIRLDELSSQLLMVVDNSCFVSTVLKPALAEGTLVLADRSNFISSIAYGVAGGLGLGQIDQMFRVSQPPKADRVYVLRLPWDVARRRTLQQCGGDGKGLDRFERRGEQFFRGVQQIYDGLVTGPPELLMVVNHSVRLENIKFVDANRPFESVVTEIVRDISKLIAGA